jgi:AraC family transcriptional regulator of adaptative response/methylated-DNA-[protein]-cysteine methyltransferase
MKNDLIQKSKDYSRIEKAIHFLEENFQYQPSLQQVAQNINVSEFHFHRIFQRWTGISPKRFLQYLTKEYAKKLLKDSNVLDVSYAAGLSAPSRLHDLFVNCEAMSPGEYKQKAKGLTIDYGFHPTPFGECFIALTDRGLCNLSFIGKANRKIFLEDFRKTWKNAKLNWNQNKTGNYVKQIFLSRRSKKTEVPINVLCKGTNFQIKVWEALLKIPSGNVVTYKTIAQMIGHPKAVRAVGTAVGENPIAYLIPCHRVIRGEGILGGYRWGTTRKRAILGMEAVHNTHAKGRTFDL